MAMVLDSRLLKVHVKKAAVGAPLQTWVNTYEVDMGGVEDLNTVGRANLLADAFVFGEQFIHIPEVNIIQVRVSSWLPDSDPYAPESFIDFPYDALGEYSIAGQPEPRNMVLWASRLSTAGRNGTLFYRGALAEDTVDTSNSLNPIIRPSAEASYVTALDSLWDTITEGLTDLAADAVLAMISEIGSTVVIRPIIDLVLRGATFCKPKHKWFNRLP